MSANHYRFECAVKGFVNLDEHLEVRRRQTCLSVRFMNFPEIILHPSSAASPATARALPYHILHRAEFVLPLVGSAASHPAASPLQDARCYCQLLDEGVHPAEVLGRWSCPVVFTPAHLRGTGTGEAHSAQREYAIYALHRTESGVGGEVGYVEMSARVVGLPSETRGGNDTKQTAQDRGGATGMANHTDSKSSSRVVASPVRAAATASTSVPSTARQPYIVRVIVDSSSNSAPHSRSGDARGATTNAVARTPAVSEFRARPSSGSTSRSSTHRRPRDAVHSATRHPALDSVTVLDRLRYDVYYQLQSMTETLLRGLQRHGPTFATISIPPDDRARHRSRSRSRSRSRMERRSDGVDAAHGAAVLPKRLRATRALVTRVVYLVNIALQVVKSCFACAASSATRRSPSPTPAPAPTRDDDDDAGDTRDGVAGVAGTSSEDEAETATQVRHMTQSHWFAHVAYGDAAARRNLAHDLVYDVLFQLLSATASVRHMLQRGASASSLRRTIGSREGEARRATGRRGVASSRGEELTGVVRALTAAVRALSHALNILLRAGCDGAAREPTESEDERQHGGTGHPVTRGGVPPAPRHTPPSPSSSVVSAHSSSASASASARRTGRLSLSSSSSVSSLSSSSRAALPPRQHPPPAPQSTSSSSPPHSASRAQHSPPRATSSPRASTPLYGPPSATAAPPLPAPPPQAPPPPPPPRITAAAPAMTPPAPSTRSEESPPSQPIAASPAWSPYRHNTAAPEPPAAATAASVPATLSSTPWMAPMIPPVLPPRQTIAPAAMPLLPLPVPPP